MSLLPGQKKPKENPSKIFTALAMSAHTYAYWATDKWNKKLGAKASCLIEYMLSQPLLLGGFSILQK